MESMQSHFKVGMTQWSSPDTSGTLRRAARRRCAPLVSGFSGPPLELSGVLSREHLGPPVTLTSVHHELRIELLDGHS